MKVKKLTIHSRHKNLDRVIHFIEKAHKRERWPEALHDRILLASSEAATNALEHGNQSDPSKLIKLELFVENQTVTLSVEDEGPGFVRSDVPDPLAEENLLRDSGRGLFIIDQIADSVSFLEDGRKIVLTFEWDNHLEDKEEQLDKGK